jgi:hypothetical protein
MPSSKDNRVSQMEEIPRSNSANTESFSRETKGQV